MYCSNLVLLKTKLLYTGVNTKIEYSKLHALFCIKLTKAIKVSGLRF